MSLTDSVRILLINGPFDHETRNVSPDKDGRLPEEVRILDAVQTMDSVVAVPPGTELPITYSRYTRDKPNGAGLCRYVYVPPSEV